MDKQAPIGVFDSGNGGLSMLRELDNLMPYENYMYVGDTARVPYGTRSEEDIITFAEQIINFLEKKKCKMIVIACNTISGLLPEITRREQHGVPVVGIINYGCVSAALYVTYNFRIGVLATKRTVDSEVYRKIMNNFDPTVHLYPQECTELIPHIEAGHVGSPEVRRLAENYLHPLLKADIDTLILGCTHLPHIKMIIQDIIGSSVTLIDPARRTAVLCMKTLVDNNLHKSNHKVRGVKHYFVTGKPADFKKSAQLVIGWNLPRVERITL
jgi:glutamate racemase